MITTRKKGDISKSPPNATTIAALEELETPAVTGETMMDEVIAEPTIDRYLDRAPKLNTPADYEEIVRALQWKRAQFITAEQKRRNGEKDGDKDAEVQEG